MDEAKQVVDSLRAVQSRIVYGEEMLDASERIEVAIDLIQRLAAEVERLRPRGMGVGMAVAVLNWGKYMGVADWKDVGSAVTSDETKLVLEYQRAVEAAEELLPEEARRCVHL